MGKTTVARMFADEGVPVFDSDATVHELYRGTAVKAVEACFPNTSVDGQIDRNLLASRVLQDPFALRQLEGIVHPLVEDARREFIARERSALRSIIVLDIPLLFESGADDIVDLVVVVSAPMDIQRGRAMARDNMTPLRFEEIIKRQVSNIDKRLRAQYIVDTSTIPDVTRQQVRDVVRSLSAIY